MASRKCKNDMKLIEGAYENLITNELEQSIKDKISLFCNVKKDCVVVIDSLKNISPETFKKWGL